MPLDVFGFGRIIRKKIVDEVAASKYFTILTDETTEEGKLDQVTLCLRYVPRVDIRQGLAEASLKFFDITDRPGLGLAKAIVDNFQLKRLDMREARIQDFAA